jgi:hypothetical protein
LHSSRVTFSLCCSAKVSVFVISRWGECQNPGPGAGAYLGLMPSVFGYYFEALPRWRVSENNGKRCVRRFVVPVTVGSNPTTHPRTQL